MSSPRGGRRYEIRAWSPNSRARKRKGEILIRTFWFWSEDPHWTAIELLRLNENQRAAGAYGSGRWRFEVVDHGPGGERRLGEVVSYDELLRRAGSYRAERDRRRDVEGVGHHGYAPASARPETPAERLRRLAARRRRYRALSQSPGEQGPGYDQRRPRRRRSRKRRHR